jgi:hypothetical protein
MNKQIFAAVLAVGLSVSAGMASAATAFQSNVEVETTDCTLLAETITLGVSAKVHGAYACNETTNLVEVGACHEGGSRAQGAACQDTDANTPGDQLPAGCDAVGGFSTIPDYKMFFTSSRGGVMQEFALGGRCSASTVVGQGFTN